MRRAAAVGLLLMAIFVVERGYRLGRVIAYVDPDYSKIELVDSHRWVHNCCSQFHYDSAMRVINPGNRKSAVGTEGIFGVGLMRSRQKLMFLPEAHTDFIYATVGEELGLWGCTAVLLGFVVILMARCTCSCWLCDTISLYQALGTWRFPSCSQALMKHHGGPLTWLPPLRISSTP